MRKQILLLWLLAASSFTNAQTGFQLSGHFGTSGSSISRKESLVGSSSVEMDKVQELGIILSKEIGEKFKISTGVNYSFGKVAFTPGCMGCFAPQNLYLHNPDFQMISIPMYGEYSLGKYLFATAGPLIDFQVSEGNNFNDQSGLGYMFGLGARAFAGDFIFSLFPNYKRHGVAPFEQPESPKFIFQELGVQFGIGYKF